MHLELGNNDQAIADIDELCRLKGNEEYQPYLMTRARAYAHKCEWEKASRDIEVVFAKPLFKKPSWPDDWLELRGFVLANVGRFEEAIADLKKARTSYEMSAGMYVEELTSKHPVLSLTPDDLQERVNYYSERIARIESLIKAIKSHIPRRATQKSRGSRHRSKEN